MGFRYISIQELRSSKSVKYFGYEFKRLIIFNIYLFFGGETQKCYGSDLKRLRYCIAFLGCQNMINLAYIFKYNTYVSSKMKEFDESYSCSWRLDTKKKEKKISFLVAFKIACSSFGTVFE